MRRKLILITILLVLLSALASAELTVDSTAVKKDIFLSEVATFDVTITNDKSYSDIYTFSTADTNWILLTQQFEIGSEETKTFRLEIYPGNDVLIGIHALNVKIRSTRTNKFVNELFLINLRPYDPIFGTYRPSLYLAVEIDEDDADPRKKFSVGVYMRNRNSLDIGQMIVEIEGDLFQKTVQTSMGPLEEKRDEYLFDIDPLAKPGLYTLIVSLKVKNVTISKSTQSYGIVAYGPTTLDRDTSSFLFKKTDVIRIQNTGNAEKVKIIGFSAPLLKRWFMSTEPKGEIGKDDQGTIIQWTMKLAPQELREIVVVTNYRVPIFILVLIVVLIVLYFLFRSPILLAKEALVVGSTEQGFEHLKIRLFVKNRSGAKVENVLVHDRVPAIAELIPKKTLGTIHPEKITKQERKGTMIKWNLETLDPFEERIITYEIKSRLKIIGNLTLPSSRTTFMNKHKERTMYSNRLIVSN